MTIIISTGSNLGDRIENLTRAREELEKIFILRALSRIYKSDPVDYLQQPFFYNQMLEFDGFNCKNNIGKKFCGPQEIMQELLKIENDLGRKRIRNEVGDVIKGPRIIDIDFIFYDLLKIDDPIVTLPHPRWHERNFVFLPLMELPFYKKLLENSDNITTLKNIYESAKGNASPI
ncbi:MAG: 2-amino-4-hydroxy-6-hydroxymethyldihydropteridine diphosphokinase [Oligoflexia bacterium]|nr:2-amino-4-hydroxy-6-hydroxymethyldihydropteridine diphosphokinase [Oligoflexia bacterium]